MTFLEHLEELRVRLIRSLVALVVGFAACWGFREQIFHFLTEPLRKAYPGVKFIYTGPSEALMLYMKMAFFVGHLPGRALHPLPGLGLHRPRPLRAREGLRRCRSS